MESAGVKPELGQNMQRTEVLVEQGEQGETKHGDRRTDRRPTTGQNMSRLVIFHKHLGTY